MKDANWNEQDIEDCARLCHEVNRTPPYLPANVHPPHPLNWGAVGWQCPRCGRGLAPWVQFCTCIDLQPLPHSSAQRPGQEKS